MMSVAFLLAMLAVAPTNPSTGRLVIDAATMNATHVVFVHDGDLWRVPRTGGTAERLTDTPGYEGFPAFAPDGRTLAYSGGVTRYATDVFVMPATGGAPVRLTYHPEADDVRGWTPDGTAVLFASARERAFTPRLYTFSLDGVMPEALPMPTGYMGAFAPEGRRLVLVPDLQPGDWQYYRGGLLRDLAIVDLAAGRRLGTVPREGSFDTFPMWIGDAVYFVSDRSGTFNLFRYDLRTQRVTACTAFETYGISYASAGPDGIVLVVDGYLFVYDLARGEVAPVAVTFPERAFLDITTKRVPVDDWIRQVVPDADGGRLAVEARGEILTLDVRTGAAMNRTRTSGVAERNPAWSPDGTYLAYFSDASGAYELHVQNVATGAVRPIPIEAQPAYYRELTWSPDGSHVAFSGQRLDLWIADVDRGTTQRVATSDYVAQGTYHPAWSPDGRWLAYARADRYGVRTIYAYEMATGARLQVSDGRTHTDLPVFDPDGHYLYVVASDNARLAAASDVGWSLLSSDMAAPLVSGQLQVVVLAADGVAPIYPAIGRVNPAAAARPPCDVVRIDAEGLSDRILPLPVERRVFRALHAGAPGELFARIAEWPPTPGEAHRLATPLYRYRLADPRTLERVALDVDAAETSADGTRLLTETGGTWVVASTADPEVQRPIRFGASTLEVDLRAEWRQLFDEVWRKVRDTFYDPNLHGQDLAALQAHYASYLPGIRGRNELNTLFRRMLGHLSVSHLRVGGGDVTPSGLRAPDVGLLGADVRVEKGRYRFTRILRSGASMDRDPFVRAPLDQPGAAVREGEYLLAVDGEPVTADRNLYAYFQGTALRPTVLTVGPAPGLEGARAVTVVPLPGEHAVRRADWVAANRRRVAERSGGRLGYVYVGDYSGEIQTFFRELVGQQDREGLVIDQRDNGGGTTADVLIEWLMREPTYRYAYRYGADFVVPVNVVRGPKVLLVNEKNGSAAETFALMFQLRGVGPVVGQRTVGAGIGAALFQAPLIDDGFVAISNRAAYNPVTGRWDIENHGIVPDVEVPLTLEDWNVGRDPQLETAVRLALDALKRDRPPVPRHPAYPVYPR